MTMQNKISGSLFGGAVGDALGYPVEFYSYGKIQERYGEHGITRFDLKPHGVDENKWTGKALVSDDTQMTLFTACGLLNAKEKGISFIEGIRQAYIEWLSTQDEYTLKGEPECWLTTRPELNHRRAPGRTCITSLLNIAHGRHNANFSKGCGGIMRIAPIPLYAVIHNISIEEADRLAGDAAAITHHHPLGIIPAAMTSHIIYRLMKDERPTPTAFEDYIHESMEAVCTIYPEDKRYLSSMSDLIDMTLRLATNEDSDVDNIKSLGGGWVAEETLAIALYCSLRHFNNFEQAIIASVNHAGDSDSTGAVTGNILGTAIGFEAIPQYFKDDLELHDILLQVTDKLFL